MLGPSHRSKRVGRSQRRRSLYSTHFTSRRHRKEAIRDRTGQKWHELVTLPQGKSLQYSADEELNVRRSGRSRSEKIREMGPGRDEKFWKRFSL